ncbi:MAG: bifunctional folylpolyglutamate synthase/dihydrofolate synthase [Lachnospiraceae bacterium]|nr:bifunctional folylpolyglutamate synthase/dihydrofolate synthase [Lachnospiraceae bacterium]
MDYIKAVNEIMGRTRFGNRPGVEISAELLQKLGNPEKSLRIIHVAGTNGKGSVCTYIANTLTATGHRTGLFTSPHLVDFRERIRVDGQEISEDEVVRLFEQIDALGGSPTMFDISFIMAILHFVKTGCEFAVLETGLGGRLDSTTAVSKTPEVCVITSISKDHTGVLGDSIEEIAREKAGIIKPGCKVVLGQMPDRAKETILDYCRLLGVKDAVGAEVGFSEVFVYKNFTTAGLALEMVGVSAEEYKALCRGEEKLAVAGRMQVLSEHPTFIVDGAHNPAAAKELVRCLEHFYPGRRFTFLIAGLQGHDTAGVIKRLLPVADGIFTVGLEDARAYSAQELSDIVAGLGGTATACEDLSDAVNAVTAAAFAKDNVAVACGSFYLIGDILDEVSFAP